MDMVLRRVLSLDTNNQKPVARSAPPAGLWGKKTGRMRVARGARFSIIPCPSRKGLDRWGGFSKIKVGWGK